MSIVSLDVLLYAEQTPTNTTIFGQSIWWQQDRQTSYTRYHGVEFGQVSCGKQTFGCGI